jgi:hypothetical protein
MAWYIVKRFDIMLDIIKIDLCFLCAVHSISPQMLSASFDNHVHDCVCVYVFFNSECVTWCQVVYIKCDALMMK